MASNDKATIELWLHWRQLNAVGRYEEAIRAAEEMLALSQDDATARTYGEVSRNVASRNLQRLQQADAQFRQAMADGSEQGQAWAEHGWGLLELDLYEAAARDFEEALALNPQSDAAWTGLGVARSELGPDASGALDCLERAIALNPNSEDAWYYRGMLLGQVQRHAEAMACFDHIIEGIDPDNHWAWYAKGLEEAAQRRNEEAMRCYVKALQLDPETEAAWSCHEIRLQADS